MVRKPNDYNMYYTNNLLAKLQISFHKSYIEKKPMLMMMILEDVVSELPSSIKAEAKKVIEIAKANVEKASRSAAIENGMPLSEKKNWQTSQYIKQCMLAKDAIMSLMDREGLLAYSPSSMVGVSME